MNVSALSKITAPENMLFLLCQLNGKTGRSAFQKHQFSMKSIYFSIKGKHLIQFKYLENVFGNMRDFILLYNIWQS